MKAVVYKGVGALTLEDRAKPEIVLPDDMIVRVEMTGICGTDRNIYLGNFVARAGVILGHEAVGVVESAGPAARDLRPGDRVIVNPTLHCGDCAFCRRGALNFCDHKAGSEVGVDRDGTFAELAVLPSLFLHRIPAGMSFERAALVEPLACVLNNAEAASLGPSDDVVVLGAGPIGVVWGMVAKRIAARVTLVETDPFRLAFARQRFDRVVDAREGELLVRVVAANSGAKPRVVVDTTGVLLEAGIDLVSKGGRVVMMGFHAGYRATIAPLTLVNNGIRLIGAGDYNSHIFPGAIDLAASMPLEELITHTLPLEDHARAFQLLASGGGAAYGAMKVALRSVR